MRFKRIRSAIALGKVLYVVVKAMWHTRDMDMSDSRDLGAAVAECDDCEPAVFCDEHKERFEEIMEDLS